MKKFIAILLTLSVLICLCACGAKKAETEAEENPSTKPEAEEPAKVEETPESSDVLPVSGAEISFAFCNVAPPDHPQNVAYREIAEEISELSGGKITMNIYDNAQMGGIIETMHGTIDGTIEMVVVSMPTICSFDYGLMVNDLPYLWPSVEVACSILNDDSNGIAAAEMANLESKGAHFLGVANNGPMIVANSKREIASPADMAGLKIRTPEAATEQAFMEACGAIPTIMASTEVYTSLQTKVVDGHDFDPIITMSGGYDEVTSYITETNHILVIVAFASFFGRLLTLLRIPSMITTAVLGISSSPTVIMLIIISLLFVFGMVMDMSVSIILLVPIIQPIMLQLGLDPVHIAMIIVFALGIGLITPPMALNLFVGSQISKVPMSKMVRPIIPYVVASLLVLLLIVLVPQISTLLPSLLGY